MLVKESPYCKVYKCYIKIPKNNKIDIILHELNIYNILYPGEVSLLNNFLLIPDYGVTLRDVKQFDINECFVSSIKCLLHFKNNNVVHNDISMGNIIINEEVKLIDFQTSRIGESSFICCSRMYPKIQSSFYADLYALCNCFNVKCDAMNINYIKYTRHVFDGKDIEFLKKELGI